MVLLSKPKAARLLTQAHQEDSSKCSIFTFDILAHRSQLPLARNAFRKFRTLRHPGVLRVLETSEVRMPLEKEDVKLRLE